MKITNFLISGFYVGYIKYAPGTIASFLALLIYYFIPSIFIYQIMILLFLLIIAFYLCFLYSENSLIKDPSYIVIDEIVGMYIAVFMLPKSILLYIVAFLLFRFFDIYKPCIINKSQNLDFGIGIMVDDILSGIFSLIICWILLLW